MPVLAHNLSGFGLNAILFLKIQRNHSHQHAYTTEYEFIYKRLCSSKIIKRNTKKDSNIIFRLIFRCAVDIRFSFCVLNFT